MKLIINLLIILLFSTNVNAYEQCTANSQQMNITVNTNHIIRHAVPKEMFGFNVPWHSFEGGYMVSGAPRPELIEFLKPFSGALYRYPGGSPSNVFSWENSILPVSERKKQLYEYDQYYSPILGYDEFLRFIKEVNGKAILTLNLVGNYPHIDSPEAIGNDAHKFVDWLRNKSPVKCVGTPSCAIEYLELGNELDWSPYNWTGDYYSARAKAVIDSVGDTIPSKVWIANGKTAPSSENDILKFNNKVADNLSKIVANIAIHPYYDGNPIPVAMGYLNLFYATWSKYNPNASVIITEHGR